MIPLLILRPQPGANETARRAAAHGLRCVVHPLFVIRPVAFTIPDLGAFDVLVLTSANAVREARRDIAELATLPLAVVGRETARAAEAAGLRPAIVGDADAAALFASLAERGYRRALHLAGADHRPHPDGPLHITTCVVYEAVPAPAKLPEAQCVALIHSARAAARFAAICPVRSRVHVVAISAGVAAAAGTGWASLNHAASPRDEEMLALAAPLCKSGREAVQRT